MIVGKVNSTRQATIPISIIGPGGIVEEVNIIVDTGFSGSITLPLSVITRLQLQFESTEIFIVADNQNVNFDLYSGARLMWDGLEREILVVQTEDDPLMGMAVLENHTLFVDVRENGIVRIDSVLE